MRPAANFRAREWAGPGERVFMADSRGLRRGPAITAIAAAAVLLGFLLVLQVRSVRDVRAEHELPSRRAEELAALVAQAERAQAALHLEVDDLRRRLREYEQLVAAGQEISAAISREVDQYRMILGLTWLEGEGIEVVLLPGRGGSPLPTSVVQSADLAGLGNELWAAGAEAIAVNGQRVLGRSAFRGIGPRVSIDGMAHTAPFRVVAIGDGASLESSLRARDGFVDGLRAVGMDVRVRRLDKVRLPPYRAPLAFRWARPIP
jgi:uncharacterized protein YlxW (UPF0749 family)